jgi:hypothetical protein
MYYLVIRNLGVQKCIDRNRADIYVSGHCYTCSNDFPFIKEKLIRRVWIRCGELPGPRLLATIYYSDQDIIPAAGNKPDEEQDQS